MKLVLAILVLAFSIPAFAQFDPSTVSEPANLASQTITGTDPWTIPLMPVFQSAAKKYNVPLSLLLTLAYYGSNFENRGGAPTIEGGYGIMALRDNTLGGTSLNIGATLLSTDATTLKTDPVLSIQAAAAVLDKFAKDKNIDRSQGLQAWLDAVIKYAGLDEENSRFFASEVYDKLRAGLDYTNAAGERFQVAAQNIGMVNTAALQPPPIVGSSDYGPAIWDPAASCNYTASWSAKDTVIIHTIEGSSGRRALLVQELQLKCVRTLRGVRSGRRVAMRIGRLQGMARGMPQLAVRRDRERGVRRFIQPSPVSL